MAKIVLTPPERDLFKRWLRQEQTETLEALAAMNETQIYPKTSGLWHRLSRYRTGCRLIRERLEDLGDEMADMDIEPGEEGEEDEEV